MKPKEIFADAVATSTTSILIGEYDFKVEEKDKNQFKKYILSLIQYYNKIFPMNILDGANNVLIKQLIDYRDDKAACRFTKYMRYFC